MSDAAQQPNEIDPRAKTTRRGSEKRARNEAMALRVTGIERQEIEAAARAAGYTELGAYIRDRALAKPETRAGGNGPVTRSAPIIPYRVTAAERTLIEEAAGRAGISPGAYVRAMALKKPVTLARNRVPVDRAALAQILALMGRLVGNSHQIAKRGNFGEASAPELADELRAEFAGWREAKDVIMRALGKRPS